MYNSCVLALFVCVHIIIQTDASVHIILHVVYSYVQVAVRGWAGQEGLYVASHVCLMAYFVYDLNRSVQSKLSYTGLCSTWQCVYTVCLMACSHSLCVVCKGLPGMAGRAQFMRACVRA